MTATPATPATDERTGGPEASPALGLARRPVFAGPPSEPGASPDGASPSVYVALPTYDGRVEVATAGRWLLGLTRGRCRVGQFSRRASLLAWAFNDMWCEAINLARRGQVTRFAMLHADVVPLPCPGDGGRPPAWADALERVLQETDADVASAVIPIKDTRGLTSTAIGDPLDPWRQIKRLTVREALALPESFRAADCGFPGRPLLVNTGLWMCRLDRGDWHRRVHFEIRDRVVEGDDGDLRPQTIPEDWGWSRRLWQLGVDVVATRAVAVEHVGRIGFVSDQPWGACAADPAWDQERDPMHPGNTTGGQETR